MWSHYLIKLIKLFTCIVAQCISAYNIAKLTRLDTLFCQFSLFSLSFSIPALPRERVSKLLSARCIPQSGACRWLEWIFKHVLVLPFLHRGIILDIHKPPKGESPFSLCRRIFLPGQRKGVPKWNQTSTTKVSCSLSDSGNMNLPTCLTKYSLKILT